MLNWIDCDWGSMAYRALVMTLQNCLVLVICVSILVLSFGRYIAYNDCFLAGKDSTMALRVEPFAMYHNRYYMSL